VNVTIEKSVLVDALGRAVGACANGPVAIFKHVLLETVADRLSLTGTDTKITLQTSVEAVVEAAGATAAPGRELLSMVRLLPAGDVTLSMDGHAQLGARLTVACGGATNVVSCLAASDFQLPKDEVHPVSSIPGDTLAELLSLSLPFTDKPGGGRDFDTVWLHKTADGVRAVATDAANGLMLPRELAGWELPDLALPAVACSELAKFAGGEDWSVGSTESVVCFRREHDVVTYTMMAVPRPDIDAFVPTTWRTRVFVDRSAIVGALRRAGGILEGKHTRVRLVLAPGEIRVSSKSDASTFGETVEAETEGEGLTIETSYVGLLRGLAIHDDEQAEMKFGESTIPIVFAGKGSDRAVVSPMHLEG